MNISKLASLPAPSVKEYKSYNIRILLVAAYKLVQESLKVLIEDNLGMSVIASISNLNNLSEYTNLKNPDVVLIYLTDEDNESVEIISKLTAAYPRVRVVVAADGSDLVNQARAMQLGAAAIVRKDQNARTLITAVRQAHRNESGRIQARSGKLSSHTDSAKSQNVKAKSERAEHCGFGPESITKREKEIISMIGEGLKSKDIAGRLSISEKTAQQHLGSIFRKLEVPDRINLVIYAYEHGLLQSHR